MDDISEDKILIFSKYLAAKKTTIEMMEARNFDIEDEREVLTYTIEDFIDTYTRKSEIDYNELTHEYYNNSGHLTYIEFVPPIEDGKSTYGVDFAKEFTARVLEKKAKITDPEDRKSRKVKTGIAIIDENLSADAKTNLAKIFPFKIEVFNLKYLTYNPTKSGFSPEYTVLSPVEQKEFLETYSIRLKQLPVMQVTDPVARYYGWMTGEVHKRRISNFLSETLNRNFIEYFAIE